MHMLEPHCLAHLLLPPNCIAAHVIAAAVTCWKPTRRHKIVCALHSPSIMRLLAVEIVLFPMDCEKRL